MPLYDYDCAACGRRFEVIHGVNADPPASCPLCGKGPVKKAISAPTVHYKGSGWAKRDRRTAVKSSSSRGSDDGPSDSRSDGASSTSEKGSSAGSGSSSDGSDASTPASTGAGDSSSGPSKPSKPGASSKAPAKTAD